MPEHDIDESSDLDRSEPAPEPDPQRTAIDVDSGATSSAPHAGDDSSERALAALGMDALAELERLRAKLGLIEDDAEPQPTRVGRYRLLERIGHGGMGVVYRAHDPELGRAVAIKLVHAPSVAATTKLRARLLREAKVLARLAHANVVRVYDCGHHEGEVYLAMEYVEGTTLRAWQAAPGRTPTELVDAYVAAATGLAAAHDVGIVHRDFKPENVLVASDGNILVGDFGLAVGAIDHDGPVGGETPPSGKWKPSTPVTMTKTGALLGTVLYMSPEQLRGDPATARSDQFAFCVALWEALAGRRPFDGEDQVSLLVAIEKGRTHGGERLSGKLRRALERGLALEPGNRFPSIAALAAAIGRRRGVSTPIMVALVGASLGAGLLMYPMVFTPSEPREECGLERAVVEVRESDGWAGVRERLGEAGVGAGLERLDLHLRRLEEQAHVLCQRSADPGDEAKRQHLQSWVESLGELLATAGGRSTGELVVDIEALEHARLTAPPPRALGEGVVQAIRRSETQERSGDLDGALAEAVRALTLAHGRDLELAVAHARHGRVLALQEHHDLAMEAYGAAASFADASSYDDARLEARLLAAKTAIMRLEEPGRGNDALREVQGLLVRLDEPWLSARRADYRELLAARLEREGRMDEALREQWLSLSLRTVLGEVYDAGLGYLNLGTIYERRSRGGSTNPREDLRRAHACYERALEILLPTRPSPAWGQAAYGLGRALASDGTAEDYERAERLLEDVRAARKDLRLPATKDLLLLQLQREQLVPARALADELLGLLTQQPPESPSFGLEAWANLAMVFAFTSDLPALDRALAEVEAFSSVLARRGAQRREIDVRLAELEVTLASVLAEDQPERAVALARAAHDRLEALPIEDRPVDLFAAAKEFSTIEPD